MKLNLFWPVYKNLEKEVLNLTYAIHFSDKQLNTYSNKIAELILRCGTYIESVSKELYKEEFKKDNNDFLQCIDKFIKEWKLEEKVVQIAAQNMYFSENQQIFPFKKDEKKHRFKNGNKIFEKKGKPRDVWLEDDKKEIHSWNNAYNGLKHDYSRHLKYFGNVKNLLQSMAALYLLNVYYKNKKVADSINKGDFPDSLGSDLFIVNVLAKYSERQKDLIEVLKSLEWVEVIG
ncbi:hypothetical protein Hs30E_05230 [Lactococcus hodotermopsidis]|uniref:Uncharacterized protein n=1 Tax=Pseudolactococcus hodotermopsidis TaxID=2709157 RepID=A0A6A0B9D2_9LACT|nr:hypothetical protein [Lactococcus hodotermopsidis]GFH41972.1 hypothetical protein Hs30E_05230 [Lactococcus hodotermopsidis]